jgi:hypothetical protein
VKLAKSALDAMERFPGFLLVFLLLSGNPQLASFQLHMDIVRLHPGQFDADLKVRVCLHEVDSWLEHVPGRNPIVAGAKKPLH